MGGRMARGASGRDLLAAFALGCEVQLRLGLAVSPEHYDRGWHITGTCGVVGAAVTAGLLGAPGRDRLAAALRLASLQTLGHREAFGTEVKPFHAGKAAAGGVLAAAEAARGRFTAGAADVLPDTGGLLRALAPGGGPLADFSTGSGRVGNSPTTPSSPIPAASSRTPASTRLSEPTTAV
ncbi:MmgE/PrpD family protein [Actinomadura luteofluorescens]|uniref:MmgE/PrpD family protein n=1 Tax=Actinomadura luteofluorescens TaxID=46163 RepID=UPI003637B908